MKNIVLIFIAIALLGIAVFQISSVKNGRAESANVSQRAKVQKSNRNLAEKSGGGRSESNVRSLDELRETWKNLLPERGHSLFSEKEMSAFLKTLNLRETEMLAKDLLSRGANKDATSRVIGRWGELDAEGALAFLEDGGIENTLFKKNLFTGWAKIDAKTAFSHLTQFPISDESERNLVNMTGPVLDRESIVRFMAKTDSESALRLLNEWSIDQFDAMALSGKFDDGERDAILESLPNEQNWPQIANQLKNRIFRWKNNDGRIQHGPGFVLFQRWANESPDDAIAWFREHESEISEDQGTNVSRLVGFWYHEHPEIAAEWIDRQLADKSQNDIVEILSDQFHYFEGEEHSLKWGRHLPNDGSRFFAMKRAASKPIVHTDGLNLIVRGPPAYEMDPDLIRKTLPTYNLSTAQEQEILQILREREAGE